MGSVRFENVSKVYPGGHVGVESLSLDIADGEFVVLVGPSGCGKSTTLRLLAGLEEATGGVISIGGRVVNDVHPKDRDIAMVFQNYALYPHMSVEKNMSFALRLRKTPRDEIRRRVLGAAKLLGIEELLDRKPRQLSGGQRQRVAVGRAIVREPAAFLFDEPLSNLDAKLRVAMRAELKALHQRLKTTTVYVTHDQEEAMTLADRVVVMHAGVVRQAGPPLELYRRPADRFVASFIGTPPMNFLEGSIEPGGAGGGWPTFVEQGPRGIRVPLSGGLGDRAGGAASAAGARMALGVRPQAIRDTAGAASTPPLVTGAIRVVELLGDTADLHIEIPSGAMLVARVPARDSYRAGEPIAVSLDPAGIHLFHEGAMGTSLLA
ncbi:MAG: ABC transporter ATP-binding protein [Phycisphaerales bacterium]